MPARRVEKHPRTHGPGHGAARPVARRLTPETDSAARLLRDIRDKIVDPVDLTVQQRRTVLAVLANGTRTGYELAELLKCSPNAVRADLKAIREELGREATTWTLEAVVGQLVHAAEIYSAKAIRMEDVGLAWAIQTGLVRHLKELGVIKDQATSGSAKLTLEVRGGSYERVRAVLERAMDPTVTGEVIPSAKARPLLEAKALPLPLDRVLPGAPTSPPPITVEAVPLENDEGDEKFAAPQTS